MIHLVVAGVRRRFKVYIAGLALVAAGLAGCGGSATASSSGSAPSAPALTLSAATLAFVDTAVGQSSAQQSITLTNSGNAVLNIASIVLGGANASDFGESTTCGTTLAANASCTISATFTPAAASSYSATITVTDNASGSPQTIALTGAGMAPQAALSASSIGFPTTSVGVQSASSSVTLTNNGNAVLNIASIVLGGANASDFGESTTCGATLAAMQAAPSRRPSRPLPPPATAQPSR